MVPIFLTWKRALLVQRQPCYHCKGRDESLAEGHSESKAEKRLLSNRLVCSTAKHDLTTSILGNPLAGQFRC